MKCKPQEMHVFLTWINNSMNECIAKGKHVSGEAHKKDIVS
jgi:hypothetical protein